jgi:hypothetical protein
MPDWLWIIAIHAAAFSIVAILAFVFLCRSMNTRKYPSIVDEHNRKRLANNKTAITAEEFRRRLARKHIAKALLFSTVMTAVMVVVGRLGW